LINTVLKYEKVIRDKNSVECSCEQKFWSTYALLFFQQEQREREKQDLELAKEMAEDDDDFPWI